MRLFGKKKDKKTAQGNPMETRMAQQEAYFEIVKQIAPDDPEVLLALMEGFSTQKHMRIVIGSVCRKNIG